MKKIENFSEYEINTKLVELSEDVLEGTIGGCSSMGGASTQVPGFIDYLWYCLT